MLLDLAQQSDESVNFDAPLHSQIQSRSMERSWPYLPQDRRNPSAVQSFYSYVHISDAQASSCSAFEKIPRVRAERVLLHRLSKTFASREGLEATEKNPNYDRFSYHEEKFIFSPFAELLSCW